MNVQQQTQTPRELDVYVELRSLLPRLDASRLTELGCGDASALVSLYPAFDIVGIDDRATIDKCRERYAVGQWLEADLVHPYEIPDSLVERAVILLGPRAATYDEAWWAARSALDRGALALVISTPETHRHTPADFRRRLARYRLDGHLGRTSFGVGSDESAFLCVVPGRDKAALNSLASWWAEREPWERQLMRHVSRGTSVDPQSLNDAVEPRAGAGHITVVTESAGQDVAALQRTAASLSAQSLPQWSWKIISTRAFAPPVDDHRVTVVVAPSRAAGLADAVADADFVAVVDEGVELRDRTLEKWLWFLTSHPSFPGVAGSGPLETEARLYRGEAIDSAGSLDAAWATAAPIGRVAYTGVKLAEAYDPTDARLQGPTPERPRAWVAEDWPSRNVQPSTARRVLLIAPWMALGGADRVNAEVLRGLRNAGWEATIVTTRAADHSFYPMFERITPDIFPLADLVALADYPRLLDYLIDSRRPDVVLVSQSELGYRLLPYLRSRHPGSAFVDLCHSEVEDWYSGGFPRFSIEYQALLDRSIVVSDYLRDWMVARGANGNRIDVCHANVDHAKFAPSAAARAEARRKLRITQDERIVLWVGRISDEKRPQLLPAISGALRRRGIDHTLLVVGEGHERFATEVLAAAEPDARLLFLGEVEHESLPGIYAASDVLVLPSRVEGIALTLFEAMACGVPVVAAGIGGQAELVTSEVGVLIEGSPRESEVDRYVDALAMILDDPSRRARMGRAARARIEVSFTAEVMRDRMLQILDDVIAHRADSAYPPFDPRLARALASEAIELIRLETDWQHPLDQQLARRQRAYRLVQSIGGRPYRWANRRRLPGVRVARNLARRTVLGE